MKTLFSKLLAIGFMVVLFSSRSMGQAASAQFFLSVDGIMGESTETNHPDQIELISFKLGLTQKGVTDFGGGAGAGKSTFSPLVVFKNVDKASAALFLACATGKHISKVVLTAARPGADGLDDYFTVTLTDVLVSSVDDDSAADPNGTQSVLESISLNFAKIQVSYRPENSDHILGAPITSGFDVKLNKKL